MAEISLKVCTVDRVFMYEARSAKRKADRSAATWLGFGPPADSYVIITRLEEWRQQVDCSGQHKLQRAPEAAIGVVNQVGIRLPVAIELVTLTGKMNSKHWEN